MNATDLLTPTIAHLCADAMQAAQRIMAEREDDEAVHDFRVALRRLRSLIRTSRPLLGKRKAKKLEERLKYFGDETSQLRDAEVLGDTLRAAEIPDEARGTAARWLQQREEHAAGMRAEVIALVGRKKLRKTLKSAMKIKPQGSDIPLRSFTDQSLGASQHAVLQLLPSATTPAPPTEQLHRLRIRFKRLRYTASMLSGQWTPSDQTNTLHTTLGSKRLRLLKQVRKEATTMQKQLGLLQDADQALALLRHPKTGLPMQQSHQAKVIETALIGLRKRLVQASLAQLQQVPGTVLGR